jgi:hypothetical protein
MLKRNYLTKGDNMTISDMIEKFMEECFDTVSKLYWRNAVTFENILTKEDVIKAFKIIDEKWETYEIDASDWIDGHKLIYQYLGETLIREYYDINFASNMIKQLGKILYDNRNCETMKLKFEHWKLEQMNKDFE